MRTSLSFPFARQRDLGDLSSVALVLIDLQCAFTDPVHRTFLPDAPQALEASLRLLTAFRHHRRPIVFTRHAHSIAPTGPGMGHWWSGFILENTDESHLAPELRPQPHEKVIRKESYSAFRNTDLEPWLRQQEVNTLVLAGTMTHICVDTSAREAFMAGFDVIVACDACASKNKVLHEAALHGLSHAVARMEETSSLVSRLKAFL